MCTHTYKSLEVEQGQKLEDKCRENHELSEEREAIAIVQPGLVYTSCTQMVPYLHFIRPLVKLAADGHRF